MPRRLLVTAVLIGLCLLVAVGIWKTQNERIAVTSRPRAVMGTDCTLVAIVPRHRRAAAEEALRNAEAVLRQIEGRMSSWIDVSEIGKLNASDAGKQVEISPETRTVLRAARAAFEQTGGAFDTTCRPLIEVWRTAAKKKQLPADDEIAAARSASTWGHFELSPTAVVKRNASARIDLGGIAKGYAIDAAVAVMRAVPIDSGMVDVGGDQRLFGRSIAGKAWPVAVKHPFADGPIVEFTVGEAAVCTSGNYARFFEIDGHRYSHIIDPRTGRPADVVSSVTVVAPTAIEADIWATALSVLGPDGFDRLPEGVHALVINGDDGDVRTFASPDFPSQ